MERALHMVTSPSANATAVEAMYRIGWLAGTPGSINTIVIMTIDIVICIVIVSIGIGINSRVTI